MAVKRCLVNTGRKSPSLRAGVAERQLKSPPYSERKANSSSNAKDEAAFLSEPKIQNDEAASLSEPKIQQVTALTGRTVLLPVDEVAVYRQHVQDFADQFQPVGPLESEIVQALADHAWRLNRIASLEMAIFAAGHEQFAGQFADRAGMQGSFTQMHTFLHYEKQIRNLQIQEMRLPRNREKDTAELRRLQHERVANLAAIPGNKPASRHAREPENSAPSRIAAETARKKPERASNLCDNGFVFSSSFENSEMDAANQPETAPAIGSQGLESNSKPQIAA